MALPDQLKSARLTNTSLASTIDDRMGDLEKAIAAILGVTIDTDVTESALAADNAGRITKALLRQKAAGPVGLRILDSTSGKEFRLVLDGDDLKLDENTGSEETPTWTNRITSPLTGSFTKGDLFAAADATTLVKVPVGADGQVLTADAAEDGGMKFADIGDPNGTTIYAQITDSATIASSNAEVGFDRSCTVPADQFAAGDVIRVSLRVRTATGSAANLTLKLKFGSVVVSQVVVASPATPVQIEFVGIFRSIGAAATLSLGPHPMAHKASAVIEDAADSSDYVTIDTTSPFVIGASAEWSVADAGNQATQTSMLIRVDSPILTQ